MAGKFDDTKHPRNGRTGEFVDADHTEQPKPLPEDKAVNTPTTEEQIATAQAEYPELSQIMSEEYSRLYEEDELGIGNYRQEVEEFDKYAAEHPDEIGEIVRQRQDFISSDREAAAFMLAKKRMQKAHDITQDILNRIHSEGDAYQKTLEEYFNKTDSEPDASQVFDKPFTSLNDRLDICEKYSRNELHDDPDGELEYMTAAASAWEADADGEDVFDAVDPDDVEWAVKSYNRRHPDSTLTVDDVYKEQDRQSDPYSFMRPDTNNPHAFYALCAAAGQDCDTTPSRNAYEWALVDHELDEPTRMYVTADQRLNHYAQTDILRPGDPCWKTPSGYVSMDSYHKVLDNGGLESDRFFIYVNGSDEDRRNLKQHWDDKEWLADTASDCEPEASGRATDLYATTYPGEE